MLYEPWGKTCIIVVTCCIFTSGIMPEGCVLVVLVIVAGARDTAARRTQATGARDTVARDTTARDTAARRIQATGLQEDTQLRLELSQNYYTAFFCIYQLLELYPFPLNYMVYLDNMDFSLFSTNNNKCRKTLAPHSFTLFCHISKEMFLTMN